MNCQDPGAQVGDSVAVMGHLKPAMKGAYVSYICPRGLTLTGPRRSTCMGNGNWEPDPRKVECKGERNTIIIIYFLKIQLSINRGYSYVANCGRPPLPKNGHNIIPYTNTLEGAIVTYVCWEVHQEWNTSVCAEINTTAVCNRNGDWELDSDLDRCSVFSTPGKIHNCMGY